jgi:AcrR family transcriptional regulator
MIAIAAGRGFEGVTVRELMKLAGVSTRAFYDLYASKDDCFWKTYEQVASQATRRASSAQSAESDWRVRPRLIVDSLVEGIENDPSAARLALVEAYAASPDALEKVRRTERTFEAMLCESFARAPNGIDVPPLVAEGMVAGVANVLRRRLLGGEVDELSRLTEELIDWILAFPGEHANALEDLSPQGDELGHVSFTDGQGEGEAVPGDYGDRAAILEAIGKLVGKEGYDGLTRARILRAAGVSYKAFDANFDDVEDCFIVALEQRAATAFARATAAQATAAQATGDAWTTGIHRFITTLCAEIVNDPVLLCACMDDAFRPGSPASASQQRLIHIVVAQLMEAVPSVSRPSRSAIEASEGAIWTLFQRHVIRALKRPPLSVSATLSFMVLVPAAGPEAALEAIAVGQ